MAKYWFEAPVTGQNAVDTQWRNRLPGIQNQVAILEKPFSAMSTPEDQVHWLAAQMMVNVSDIELLKAAMGTLEEKFDALQKYVDGQLSDIKVDMTALRKYVDEYFENLDLDAAVETIIKKMVADGTLGDLINQDLLSEINAKATVPAPPNAMYEGGQLNALMAKLENVLNDNLIISFVGDSITWGMNASPLGAVEPRDHSLADPKNIWASPSYANITAEWLAQIALKTDQTVVPAESKYPAAVPSGSNVFTFTGRSTMSFQAACPRVGGSGFGDAPSTARISPYRMAPEAGDEYGATDGWTVRCDAGTAATVTFDFEVSKLKAFDIDMTNAFYGDTNIPVKINVYVDGVLRTSYTTTGTGRYETVNVDLINVTTGTVRLEMTPESPLSGNPLSIYIGAIGVNRTITVKNYSIVGINTSTVLTALQAYPAALEGSDFVMVNVGTNNRGTQFDVYTGLRKLDNYIKTFTDARCYMAPNKAETLSSHTQTQREIRNGIVRFCSDTLVDCIDLYSATERFELSSITTDNLHPNNIGHALLAYNVCQAVQNAVKKSAVDASFTPFKTVEGVTDYAAETLLNDYYLTAAWSVKKLNTFKETDYILVPNGYTITSTQSATQRAMLVFDDNYRPIFQKNQNTWTNDTGHDCYIRSTMQQSENSYVLSNVPKYPSTPPAYGTKIVSPKTGWTWSAS